MVKRLKITCYFVEPAQYTLDLIKNIHSKFKIDCKFLNKKSFSSKEKIKSIRGQNFFSQIKILYNDFIKSDLIIFNGFYKRELWFFIFLNLFKKNKVFIALESDTQLNIPKNFLKKISKRFLLNILFSFKYIYGFPAGSGSHQDLFLFYGMNRNRIITMPLVVDNKKFIKKIKNNKKDIFSFLYVGRFIELKNINLIIKSFLKLPFKNIKLNLVGDGKEYEKLKYKYNKENIKFHGNLYDEELIEVYHDSNVLILSSHFEQWGLVINEALASGLPVISSVNVGANYDLVLNKNTGYLFDPKINHDLYKKMARIYNDKNQYFDFSKNAYNLMHNYWNYDLYKSQLIFALKKITNEKNI